MPIISGSSSSSSGGRSDGWIVDPNSPTFASSTSFTVGSSDLTGVYTVGTRIKLTQTTVKYFVVSSSSFGAGTTTVNITGGTDYTLANAVITNPFYGYTANPQGYPGWFNWNWNPQGFSANGTVSTAFAVNGRLCTMQIFVTAFGTSNATTFTFTAPIAANSSAGGGILATVTDSGANQSSPGLLSMSGSTAAVFKTPAGGAFTASGSKGIQGVYSYGI